jgi:hypothetical protein
MNLSDFRENITPTQQEYFNIICNNQAIFKFMNWRDPLTAKKNIMNPEMLISEKMFMVILDSKNHEDKTIHFQIVVYFLYNGGNLCHDMLINTHHSDLCMPLLLMIRFNFPNLNYLVAKFLKSITPKQQVDILTQIIEQITVHNNERYAVLIDKIFQKMKTIDEDIFEIINKVTIEDPKNTYSISDVLKLHAHKIIRTRYLETDTATMERED